MYCGRSNSPPYNQCQGPRQWQARLELEGALGCKFMWKAQVRVGDSVHIASTTGPAHHHPHHHHHRYHHSVRPPQSSPPSVEARLLLR